MSLHALTLRANSLRQRLYDRRHNVETWPPVTLDKLAIDSSNRAHGVRYDPESPSRFKRLIHAVPSAFDEFTFLDLGCGKGRALFLASHYPFKRIIGVEFSPALAAIAQRNLATYRPRNRQQCTDLSVVCLDAAQYQLPAGPLLIYMYNPFRQPVMEQVLDNVKRKIAADPAPLYIAYSLPLLKDLLKNSGFLRLIAEASSFCAFEAFPDAAR
jgi:tRNA1(Val) A37 N6-methylase TrmN6